MQAVDNMPAWFLVQGREGSAVIPTSLRDIYIAFNLAIEDVIITYRLIEVSDGLKTLAAALEYIFQKDARKLDSNIIKLFKLDRMGAECPAVNVDAYKDVDEKFRKLREVLEDKEVLERLDEFLKLFERYKKMAETDMVIIDAEMLVNSAINRIYSRRLWQTITPEAKENLIRAYTNKHAALGYLSPPEEVERPR